MLKPSIQQSPSQAMRVLTRPEPRPRPKPPSALATVKVRFALAVIIGLSEERHSLVTFLI
jgi:hypothetical protein